MGAEQRAVTAAHDGEHGRPPHSGLALGCTSSRGEGETSVLEAHLEGLRPNKQYVLVPMTLYPEVT